MKKAIRRNLRLLIISLFLALVVILSYFLFFKNNPTLSHKNNSNQIRNCFQLNQAEADVCFEETADKLIKEKGITFTLDQVADAARNTSSFGDSCHGLMHILGKTAYEYYKLDKNFEPSPNMNNCSYGFYHGFMETMFGESGSYQEGADFCRMLDQKSQEVNITGECFHGLGHGVTEDHSIEKIENVEEFIQKSLRICKLVSKDKDEQHQCGTGVFNGLANMYQTGDKGLVINKNDPLWMCPEIEEVFIRACYGLMPRIILTVENNNVESSIHLARKTIDERYLSSVIKNIMVVTVVESSTTSHVDNLSKQCIKSAPGYETDCIVGLATALFQNAKPGSEYVKAFDFCARSVISSNVKTSCYQSIYILLPKLYPWDKIIEICSTLPEGKDECISTTRSSNI